MANAKIIVGDNGGQIDISESTGATGASGYGQLYVDSTDKTLHYVDENGTDTDISTSIPAVILNGDSTGSIIDNTVDPANTWNYSTQIGGTGNVLGTAQTASNNSVMIGGSTNLLQRGGNDSVMIGGNSNKIGYGSRAVIIGGISHEAFQNNVAIIGGNDNFIETQESFIGAGTSNYIRIRNSGIVGGDNITLRAYNGQASFAGGGVDNQAQGVHKSGLIAGSNNNINTANTNKDTPWTEGSTILGGDNNSVLDANYSSIVGGTGNSIVGTPAAEIDNTVILGGFNITATASNTVYVPILHIASCPTAADNAGAITAGLTGGDVYKTATGELRIVV